MFRETLPAAKLLGFRGLLNATSNVILTEIEQGKSFEEAVRVAQEMGIAETDPSNDVDGWDASFKLCAIATVLFGVPLQPGQVERTSIRNISREQVQDAQLKEKRTAWSDELNSAPMVCERGYSRSCLNVLIPWS